MKITFPLLAVVALSFLTGAANVHAQYSSDVRPAPAPGPGPGPSYVYVPYIAGPMYVGADLGGTILQNMNVKNNGSTMRFDAGTRFDVNFGCYLAPPVSVEFETGVLWNSVKHDNNQPLTMMGQDADLYQVPLLANLVLHAPLGGGVQAYVGGGAGGVVTELYLSSGHHHRDYSDDSDTTFAYQGMAGIKWPVCRHAEVGVGYKFLGTLSHTWFDGDPNNFTHAAPAYSHSILASFTFNF